MVPMPDQITDKRTENSPSETGSPKATRDRNALPKPAESEPDTMAHFRKRAKEAGLSERAASVAAKFLRSSTRGTYNSRLQRFYSWCDEDKVDPSSAPLGKITDFLLMLFDEGLSISSIREYRSAIAAIHIGFDNGETVSNSLYISRLMRACFLQRPPKRVLLPRWDLPKVLRALTRAPFEPMHKCSLTNLSIKTSFLTYSRLGGAA